MRALLAIREPKVIASIGPWNSGKRMPRTAFPLSKSHSYPLGTSFDWCVVELRGGSGEYRSPYAGLHGWYWHNTGKEGVKIVLNASGFWTEAWMFSGDPVGEPMELQDPAPPEN